MLFVFGLFTGVMVTVATMSICIVAGRSDQASDKSMGELSPSYGGGAGGA